MLTQVVNFYQKILTAYGVRLKRTMRGVSSLIAFTLTLTLSLRGRGKKKKGDS